MGKRIISVCMGTALFVLALIPIHAANADDCVYCNPLLYPFAVAGAAVNGAVTIATAPFQPVYYTHHYKVWVAGHYNRNGRWVPGHWRSK
jgi:hypothetical protein